MVLCHSRVYQRLLHRVCSMQTVGAILNIRPILDSDSALSPVESR